MNISAYSLKALAGGLHPLAEAKGNVVGLFWRVGGMACLRLDGSSKGSIRVHCPVPCQKLGSDGIRVNLISAGPIRTMAAKSIPGFYGV